METDYKDFIRICDNIERTIHTIPHKVATLAVNFSKERFIKKNWLNNVAQPWPKTKKRKGSTLIKSGRLKRSIRKVHVGANYVIVGTDVPYARINNDGGTVEGLEHVRSHYRSAHKRKSYVRAGKRIKAGIVQTHIVRAHKRQFKRTVAQRQFIGESAVLNTSIADMIQYEITKATKL